MRRNKLMHIDYLRQIMVLKCIHSNTNTHTRDTITRQFFHAVLAYAMTWHNGQDATTWTNVMVDIGDAFARGLVYVVLSRFMNYYNLKINGRLS